MSISLFLSYKDVILNAVVLLSFKFKFTFLVRVRVRKLFLLDSASRTLASIRNVQDACFKALIYGPHIMNESTTLAYGKKWEDT